MLLVPKPNEAEAAEVETAFFAGVPIGSAVGVLANRDLLVLGEEERAVGPAPAGEGRVVDRPGVEGTED